MKDGNDYIKHILNSVDGEARLFGHWRWVPLTFPASGGSVREACYWHYQFATTTQARAYLFHRSLEESTDNDLSDEDIDWIMEEEGNRTTLLKREPGNPASGGPAQWYIKEGNFITLAEMFWKGLHLVSAFDAYKTYQSLPVLIYKRFHSVSHSANATMRRNSKMLNFVEHGHYGLPRS